MPIVEIPEFEKYKSLGYKGTFVGGCVERGEGSSFRARAHAHNWPGDLHFGWICVRSMKRVFIRNTDKPSMIMIHELAHILAPKHGHDGTWARKVRELGGAVSRRYRNYKGVGKALEKLKKEKITGKDLQLMTQYSSPIEFVLPSEPLYAPLESEN